MSEQTIYNKRKICFTEVSDFTDFQGVGSTPLYQRYDSVLAVLRSNIPEKYHSFLAEPLYNAEEDTIGWYVEKWNEHPRRLVDLKGEELSRYKQMMNEAVQCYRQAAAGLENEDLLIMGGVLKYVSDDMVFCYDNKVVMICWGMRYDTNKHKDFGSLIQEYTPAPIPIHQVMFNPGVGGTLQGNGIVNLQAGTRLIADMVPTVVPNEGYTFTGWSPNPVGMEVTGDQVFVAQYDKMQTSPPVVTPPPVVEPPKPQLCHVQFNDGGHGTLRGTTQHTLPVGTAIAANMIPQVKPKRGYKFTGWDVNPLNFNAQGDKVFTAQYEKKAGWWSRVWPWLWKILLFLLLLLLLLLLLRHCKGCSCSRPDPDNPDPTDPTKLVPEDPHFNDDDSTWMVVDPNTGKGGIYNPGDPYKPVPTPPEYRDILPPKQGVMPPIRDNDPIRKNPNPGEPVIRENILNVLMENEDKNIMELARDFKNRYPSDDYKVVYYDNVVKRMQIEIPVNERESLKQRLPQEFSPTYKLFVFDESMFEGTYRPSDPSMSNDGRTWYLKAIHAFEAWDIIRGKEDVVVAIVDNGFTLTHKEFKNKIVQPYNVWTHDQNTFAQRTDHGTHVAGTAIAAADNGSGLCGIAPNCKFMPIQVADQQGRMTTTSILDGILYALYQGADVVNVSLGLQLPTVSQLPEEEQRRLIEQRYKEEERLWNEVSRIAELHKATVVVAAGNDNCLAGIDALHRPENIIVVSALDKQNRNFNKASFSNYGADYTDISAPGVDIYSSYNNSYKSLQGTSMAAPIVTGAVALMKSLNKDLTTQQIICVLQGTGTAVSDKVGPMLQLDKALQSVKNNELNDCTPATPKPAHGDVEVTLQWGNYNDVDLYCTDPSGETLSYGHRTTRSGGKYQIDANVQNRTTTPLEHIYWPTGGAPSGTYSVHAHFCSKKDSTHDATPYVLTIKYNGREEVKKGTVSSTNRNGQVFTFTHNGSVNHSAKNR